MNNDTATRVPALTAARSQRPARAARRLRRSPGQPIVFSSGATRLCTAFTDATGTAGCGAGLSGWLAVTVNRSYQASFGGSGPYLARPPAPRPDHAPNQSQSASTRG
jgi:hypothetical protein